MDDEGPGTSHQSIRLRGGDVRGHHEAGVAALRLPIVPVADGPGSKSPLRPLRRPEEDEVRVKGQRLAKAWMDKAVDGVEKARKHVGLRLGGKTELSGPRQCHHEGPPMESRPCEVQAQAATRQVDRIWRKRPRRIKGLCDGLADGADESGGGLDPAESSEGESESSSDSSDSESDTDCFESCDPHSPDSEEDSEPSGAEAEEPAPSEAGPASPGLPESESSETESEDSSASESDSGESDPFDMGLRRGGPLTSSSSDSDSSSTEGQARAALTRALPGRPHRTSRWTSLPRHHP